MTDIERVELADPERAVAVAYAPAAVRPALTALFLLDERLGGIVGTTSEATIGLMRLAWWREALARLDSAPPPAEPLLQLLAETVLPRGVSGAMLSELEDGWSALLDGEPDAEAIARFGHKRGGTLFALATRLLGGSEQGAGAGAGWALADLAHRHSSATVRGEARRQGLALLASAPHRWPKALRPLGALAVLAHRDLADDVPRRQGSPGRLLRMLALRLTGR